MVRSLERLRGNQVKVLNSPAAVSLLSEKSLSTTSYTTEYEARVLQLHSTIWEGLFVPPKTSQKTYHLPTMFNPCFEERH